MGRAFLEQGDHFGEQFLISVHAFQQGNAVDLLTRFLSITCHSFAPFR